MNLKDLHRTCFTTLLSVFFTLSSAAADTTPVSTVRGADKKPALLFEARLKVDAVHVHKSGAQSEMFYLNNLDAMITLPGEESIGLPGSTFFLYLLSNHGGRPNEYAGTFQGVDNIAVPVSDTKIHELWYEQAIGRFSMRAGLTDLNSEFYVTDASALFLQPSFGIGPDIAQTGRNGPAIFPYSSVGIRLAWRVTERAYLQSVVLDGVPGDPDRHKGTRVKFADGEGTLWVSEGGWQSGGGESGAPRRKLGLGVWRYSIRSNDLVDTNTAGNSRKRVDAGYYLLLEHELTGAVSDSARRATAFLRYGNANPDINAIEHGLQTGVTLKAPFSQRPNDEFGIGVAVARLGNEYRQISVAAGEAAPVKEVVVELDYRAPLLPAVVMQPSIQWISYHGDASLPDVFAVALRMEVGF